MSKFLFDEPPLVVLPSLARAIGLNEAIVLQQIHFWAVSAAVPPALDQGEAMAFVDCPIQRLQIAFPFWNHSTTQRALKRLVALGLLRTSFKQHVRHYAIDHGAVATVRQGQGNKGCTTKLCNLHNEVVQNAESLSIYIQDIDNHNKKGTNAPEQGTDAQRRKPKALPEAREFLTWFGERWKEKFGSTYHCRFSVELPLVDKLIRSHTVMEVQLRATKYLQSQDPFFAKNGFTLSAFYSAFNSFAENVHKNKGTRHGKQSGSGYAFDAGKYRDLAG